MLRPTQLITQSAVRDVLIAKLRDAAPGQGRSFAQKLPGRGADPEIAVTYDELWSQAARLALALRRLGVSGGENVLLLSENDRRWLVADLALLGLGCPSVPRGTDAPSDEIGYIAAKVGARTAFVQDQKTLERIPVSTGLQSIVLFHGDPAAARGPFQTYSFDQLVEEAEPADDWFHAEIDRRQPTEIATIVFTSGTTGRPKGVVLSQANLARNLEQLLRVVSFLRNASHFLSILPPWHMFERIVEYVVLSMGHCIVYTDRRHFAEDLSTRAPDILAAVPRLWVRLMDGVLAKLAQAPAPKRWYAGVALWLGRAHARTQRVLEDRLPDLPDESWNRRLRSIRNTVPGLLTWPLYVVLARPLLRKIARALGIHRVAGRGAAISGGGSLPDHVALFFESLGMPLLNGYGLTETSPVLALRLPDRNVAGTVGPPLPETEITVQDPVTREPTSPGQLGVVLARGPQVMQGYYGDASATESILDPNGWLHTGDLGRMTRRGELQVTGRAKDTIVLLSGENIDPEPLEDALTASPLIEQAVVVGQDQKYLGALLVLNQQGSGPTPHSAETFANLRREIDLRVNPRNGFRPHERIVRFKLVPRPFSVEDGSLSQTLKLKRQVIHERLSREIEELFGRDVRD